MRYVPRPPYGPATWLSGLLILLIAATTGLAAFEYGPGEELALRLREAGDDPKPAASDAVAGQVTWFASLFLLVAVLAVAAAATFLVWLWQARTNSGTCGFARQRLSRGWAIASWFIPVAGLIVPAMIVDDVWRGSAPGRPARGRHRGRTSRRRWLVLLVAWWASWLILLGLIVLRPGAPTGYGVTGIGPPEVVSITIGAGLCLAVVWAITLRQAHTLTAAASYGTAAAPRQAATPPSRR